MERTVAELVNLIERSYHDGMRSWGKCSKDCGGLAKGSTLCRKCALKILALKIGEDRAKVLNYALQHAYKIKNEILRMGVKDGQTKTTEG